MAREPLQEKELQIKKTARRRLVGAIAMVVILLIVLPFLLKDHATDSAQDPVKITIVNEGANSEPIPELNDAGQGFESNINPTEVTGYTQPTVLPSQQDEIPANKDSKTHIALPKVTPVEQENQGLTEHSKLSQVLDASEIALPKAPTTPAKPVENTVNLEKEQLLKKQAEEKAATEAKQKAEKAKAEQLKTEALDKEKATAEAKAKEKAALEKKNAEKLNAEKLKAQQLQAEKAKAEKLKSEALAQEKAKEEKAKQDKAKEEKAKEEKAKEQKADSTANPSTGKFYVQYGVFSDPKNLENLKNNLKQKGFAVETESVDGTAKKIRLRSKVYATKDEALKALKSVQAAGFSAIVAGK